MTGDRFPARVRFADSVKARLGSERGFLFDERTGRVYSLNSTGALAAAGIQARAPVTQVIADVVEAFEVELTVARQDFARFLAHLVKEGLAVADG
jgi:hypothetical protein